jgi:hypothetical protein
VLYSRAHTAKLEADFEQDLAHCREFDPAEYYSRAAAVRFRDSVTKLLSPFL